MQLLERYLRVVKFWLPKDQRQDIAAELSEDIQSEVSEREAELGRKLDEAELDAILHRFGHPMLVAERYLPQQHLIGPELFPLYRLVLKIAVLVYFVPWLLVWICFWSFDPAYRNAHPGLAWMSTLQPLAVTALCFFTAVTLGFAALDRSKAKARLLARWSLRKRAVERDPDRISRVSSAIEVVWLFFICLWWLDLRGVPSVWSAGAGAEGFSLTPIWQSLYWPALVYLASGIPLAAVSLIHPYRTRFYSLLSLARNTFSLALTVQLLRAGAWVEFSAPNSPAADVRTLENWANWSIAITLVIMGLFCAIAIARDVRRILRGRVARPVAINGLAAVLAVGFAATVVRTQAAEQNSAEPSGYHASPAHFDAILPKETDPAPLPSRTADDRAVQLASVCLDCPRVADSPVPSRPS